MAEHTNTALLLVDLQHDYLSRRGLEPCREDVVQNARELLEYFRGAGAAIAHIRTLVSASGENAMPHRRQHPFCVKGTPGASAPPELHELPGELIVSKQFFRGFGDATLESWLHERGVTRVVIAGLYTHACVRETALDAYERGFEVVLAAESIASDSPVHARETLEWLSGRAATVADNATIIRAIRVSEDMSPRLIQVEKKASLAAQAQREWQQVSYETRRELLLNWAAEVERRRGDCVELIVAEVRKPIRFAHDEVDRALAHITTAAELSADLFLSEVSVARGVDVRQRPLGVVGVLTPWNNPLALPVGKIAPAVMLGNAVVLKPAPEGSKVAQLLLETLCAAGMPAHLVTLVFGSTDVGRSVVRSPYVTGVTVTGSIQTGRSVAAECIRLGKPLQAELGGNNAAIVLADVDLAEVVPALVRNAFGYSGQRCTAIRRFVVEEAILDECIALLGAAIAELKIGDPADPLTSVGPVISAAAVDRISRVIAEAKQSDCEILIGGSSCGSGDDHFIEPTLILCRDPENAVVQQETFGPVAVIQPAADRSEAIALANGVEQGLVMAVCTGDSGAIAEVIEHASVGVVQVGAKPLPVHPDAPFGGWKASGIGSPEHGVWDVQFFTRPQALYGKR